MPAGCLLWASRGWKAASGGRADTRAVPRSRSPHPPPPLHLPSPSSTHPSSPPCLFFHPLFPVGVQADPSRLKHAAPLTLFPGTTFRGDSSCSPHSPASFLTLADVAAVPALELPGPALRFWRAVPTGEGEVTDVTWLDLAVSGACVKKGREREEREREKREEEGVRKQRPARGGRGEGEGERERERERARGGRLCPSPPLNTPHPTLALKTQSGALILAKPAFNATTATRLYTYTILGDNAVDRPRRAAGLASLRASIARLAAGQPAGPDRDPATGAPTAFTCNRPQPALDGLVKYLDGVIGAGRVAAASGELRPREEAVSGGLCVAEAAALYEGTPLPGPAGVPTTAASLEECCAKCAASPGCAIFTWCPITPGGCEVGGSAAPIPFLGCLLKGAPTGPDAGGPAPGPPPKGARGPPLLAMSGRVNAPASA